MSGKSVGSRSSTKMMEWSACSVIDVVFHVAEQQQLSQATPFGGQDRELRDCQGCAYLTVVDAVLRVLHLRLSVASVAAVHVGVAVCVGIGVEAWVLLLG